MNKNTHPISLPPSRDAGFAREVSAELEKFGSILIEKNNAYGDSALNPMGVLVKVVMHHYKIDLPLEVVNLLSLAARGDDKLARISKGTAFFDSDARATDDLQGYLMLLNIAMKRVDKKLAADPKSEDHAEAVRLDTVSDREVLTARQTQIQTAYQQGLAAFSADLQEMSKGELKTKELHLHDANTPYSLSDTDLGAAWCRGWRSGYHQACD